MDISFNEPFFKRGDYPTNIINGSTLEPLQNPWANGTNATPFDKGRVCIPVSWFRLDPRFTEFYLIMNVAVGGTTGWFPDWQGNKPWINSGASAFLDLTRYQVMC